MWIYSVWTTPLQYRHDKLTEGHAQQEKISKILYWKSSICFLRRIYCNFFKTLKIILKFKVSFLNHWKMFEIRWIWIRLENFKSSSYHSQRFKNFNSHFEKFEIVQKLAIFSNIFKFFEIIPSILIYLGINQNNWNLFSFINTMKCFENFKVLSKLFEFKIFWYTVTFFCT